jgi:hypothetical protein
MPLTLSGFNALTRIFGRKIAGVLGAGSFSFSPLSAYYFKTKFLASIEAVALKI